MIKFLLLLPVILISSLKTASQTTKDTICIPVDIAKKVLAAAEQKKILDEQIILYNHRIDGLQQTINLLQQRDSVTVKTYKEQLANNEDQKKLLQETVGKLNRQLKWKEAKEKFMGGLSIAAIVFILVRK